MLKNTNELLGYHMHHLNTLLSPKRPNKLLYLHLTLGWIHLTAEFCLKRILKHTSALLLKRSPIQVLQPTLQSTYRLYSLCPCSYSRYNNLYYMKQRSIIVISWLENIINNIYALCLMTVSESSSCKI